MIYLSLPLYCVKIPSATYVPGILTSNLITYYTRKLHLVCKRIDHLHRNATLWCSLNPATVCNITHACMIIPNAFSQIHQSRKWENSRTKMYFKKRQQSAGIKLSDAPYTIRALCMHQRLLRCCSRRLFNTHSNILYNKKTKAIVTYYFQKYYTMYWFEEERVPMMIIRLKLVI